MHRATERDDSRVWAFVHGPRIAAERTARARHIHHTAMPAIRATCQYTARLGFYRGLILHPHTLWIGCFTPQYR